jgi:hypothetical protein
MMFRGFVTLGDTLKLLVLTRSGNTPLNPAANPTFRVYGPDGLMANSTGSATQKDSGSITGTTGNGVNPIVTFAVTRVSASTFSVVATGNGSYTSGGTWNVVGLYQASIDVTAGNAYEVGQTYTVVVQASVNSANWSDEFTFTVT